MRRAIFKAAILTVLFSSCLHPDEDWRWLLEDRWNKMAIAMMAHRDILLTGVKNAKTRERADRAIKALQACDCW